MRPGASHPKPHLSCVPDLPLSPQRRRHDRFNRQHPQAGAARAEAGCRFAISRWRIYNRAVASGLSSAPKSNKGEEAATPGQPGRVRTRFRNVPRQFTLENRRLPLAPPQSSGKLRNSHVFEWTHFGVVCWEPQLENRALLCRSCGRSYFLVESRGKLSINSGGHRQFRKMR